MTNKTKKERFEYIVSLPPLNIPNLKSVQNLEVVVSTSGRGAVSHVLARKTFKDSDRELKSRTIKDAMNELDNNYGGAENYAYEIETYFEEDGMPMLQLSPRYKELQKYFLCIEIAKKKEERDPIKFLNIAKKYLDFYHSHKSQNQ